MEIIWVIIIWGIIFWIRSALGRQRIEQEQAARRVQAEYVKGRILECFSKMLAFISKADGRISKCEVDVASQCLKSLGVSEAEYRRCVGAFNGMHDFSFEAFRRCAAELVEIATNEACTLIYEMLWVVAAADGTLDAGEDDLLRNATGPLGIDGFFYHHFKRRYFGFGGADGSGGFSGAGGAGSSGGADGGYQYDLELEKAYARLGCSASDSNDAVKSAYRKAAMRYHPDRLRAEGLPEGMIAQATRSMAEINAAWDVVRKARGL